MTPAILCFLNAPYLPIGRNWLAAVTALGLDETARIVALDARTRDAFPAERVLYKPLSAQGLGALWVHRIAVLRELLRSGQDVIHSDADAVWRRDPLPAVRDAASDLTFSQGTTWPDDVHAAHGLVLCCGFFHARASDAVTGFLDAVSDRIDTDRDDQVAVNRCLAERLIRWRIEAPYQIPAGTRTFTASRSLIRAEVRCGPSVAVLPFHAFPRLVSEAPEPLPAEVTVAHPLSGKTCAETQSRLAQYGLWREGLPVAPLGSPN